MTWHSLHARWVTSGMRGYCPVLLTPVQCCELLLRGQEVPPPWWREELKCGLTFAVQPILLNQFLSDGGRAESRYISLMIWGLLEREVGEKETSCSWSTRLQGLCSYHHCQNMSSHSGGVCCLVLSKKTGMFQRTVDTMPRKCLSYKCCTIKKFFFCSSLALCCSVGQLFWWAENGTLAPC